MEGWQKKVTSALVLLIAIALGAHLIYGLLWPLVPPLVCALVLIGVYAIAFGAWRR